MPTSTTYPGVYVEEDASPSISISNSPTAVPVFIGKFRHVDGSAPPAGKCVRINSWLDFSSRFSFEPQVSVELTSSETKAGINAYHYESGCTCAHNASVDVQTYFQNGGGPCYILNVDYKDANQLHKIANSIEQAGDITLLVSTYRHVEERDAIYTSLDALLGAGKGYFLIADSTDGKEKPSAKTDHKAVYYPKLVTNYRSERPAKDSAIAVTGYKDATHKNGNEVTTLDKLEAVNPSLHAEVSEKIDQALASPVSLPPSAAIAGIYADTDRQRGVWKAPANVALTGVTEVAAISDDEQGVINDAGINVIRRFADRGIVVWGARTAAGTAANGDTNWRYVPVRRLFDSAERDIRRTMRTMVFEPNNELTWQKVRSAIEHYLHGLWTQGALLGERAEDAYSVQIGLNVTMTADQIAQGQMIATVRMAAVRPAEFIVLQFTQNMAS